MAHRLVPGAIVLLLSCSPTSALPQITDDLQACGDTFYKPSRYTCYDSDFLCPVLDGQATLRCGPDCYLPNQYSCGDNNRLVYPAGPAVVISPTLVSPSSTSAPVICTETPTTLQLNDPPYSNYFYSDCHNANQVVVTSPQPDSDLTLIGPRFLVAWPAGNSGAAVFFAPRNGENGTLGIRLVNGTSDQPLQSAYTPSVGIVDPRYGVSTLLELNTSAVLSLAILGSIRTIRDFTEGPSLLQDINQRRNTLVFTTESSAELSRLWLDNITSTTMLFEPQDPDGFITVDNAEIVLSAGTFNVTTTFDYPQLEQLSAEQVLNEESQGLITQNPDDTKALSFLSYSSKLLAGAWRFLTYFGRDSMISALLLQPVLSEGEGGAIEAVISAVLERINNTDGSTAHEETIGDYATYLHLQENVNSTAPIYDYKMIDTDFYLPVLMQSYFLDTEVGQQRLAAFLQQEPSVNPDNAGLSYSFLATLSALKIMSITRAFAQPGGQTRENLIHLKDGELVGEWRDSTYGIGGGRIPYDVNTALVPAGLRSISALAEAGLFAAHPEWVEEAAAYAQVWEDETLAFFEVTVPANEARTLVTDYTTEADQGFPSHADAITSEVVYHGLSLNGNNGQDLVRVMNTDDCFRHFFVNSTNDAQLTAFMNQSATNIQQPFPVGLSTPIGLLVANPAYGGDPVYAQNFTNADYHGTVVWSWQMAMMAAGLERQLGRCSGVAVPEFCNDEGVHANVLAAYNHLWDLIEANRENLGNEVYSSVYEDDEFQVTPLGAFSSTESNIQQLWSLTFLAVTRDESLR